MKGERKTVVRKDAAGLAVALAEAVERLATPGGPVTLALSGGSTPKRLYETLAAPPFRGRVRWDALELFFGDERAVPPDHPDSNWGMAHRALLDHVPAKAHRMPAESGDADEYEGLLRERVPANRDGIPVLDLVLLGIGTDGHTASLFPGTAALRERSRLVVMNDVPQLSTRRMTITYPLINAARRVWILAAGADKRAIVAKVLGGDPRAGTATYPVLGVDPTAGELVWWLDEAAAGRPSS